MAKAPLSSKLIPLHIPESGTVPVGGAADDTGAEPKGRRAAEGRRRGPRDPAALGGAAQ
jgi:hypothetical protein